MFITGLLLGADSSPHLGSPWQLLAYQGGTLLGAALESARECSFDQLVVTLGSASEQVRDRVDLDGVRVVESPHSDTGSSSIVPALDAVDRRADGIVVLLGDQPGITSATVWSLVAEASTPIGVSRYDDGESYPCWFGRELFGELRGLRSDADLWDPISNGPAFGVYFRSLSPDWQVRVREKVEAAYLAGDPDGPRSCAVTAWAVAGTR